METRRSFFKGLAAFVSGIAVAKASSYIPKKEEPKEETYVSNVITLKGPNGEEYHPVVVSKKKEDAEEMIEKKIPGATMRITTPVPKVRKANI